MIKAIIFDLDDTLYSWKAVHPTGMDAVSAYAKDALGADPEDLLNFYKAEAKQIQSELGKQAAIHNRLIRFLRYLEQRHLPLHHGQIMERLYWNTLLDAAKPEPGCPDALQALKQAGYILGIGSNMTLDWQMEKLKRLDLLQYFSFVVSSEEAGAEKPDPRVFHLCAGKAGVLPEECLFIGDSLKGDVLGAESVGMRALWYAPQEESFSEHAGFSHFSQLKNMLADI